MREQFVQLAAQFSLFMGNMPNDGNAEEMFDLCDDKASLVSSMQSVVDCMMRAALMEMTRNEMSFADLQ